MQNSLLLQKYFARAQEWANVLGRLPGVRAIFLSGSLARGDGNKDSDIDFFVIARSGQIWTARFFVYVVLRLCNRLAKPHHHAGQICPNHFVTDSSLLIAEQDAYAAKLFTTNQPLYDPERIFFAFAAANEVWVKQFGYMFAAKVSTVTNNDASFSPKINIKKQPPKHQFDDQRPTHAVASKKLNFFERQFESMIGFIQSQKICANTDYNNTKAKIVLTRSELRFHPHPKNTTH